MGGRVKEIHVLGPKVLHPNALRYLRIEGLCNRRLELFLENRPEGVKVPVVIEPIAPRGMRAPLGPSVSHAGCSRDVAVIDAGASFEKHPDGGLFFLRGKRRVVI